MSDDLEPIDDEASNEKALITVALAKVKLSAAVVVNALKAITHLCGASTKWVVGRIESSDTERRAVSRARINVIDAMGVELAKRVQVDAEQAQAAFDQAAAKILGNQGNINSIARLALEDIQNTETPENQTSTTDEIDTDWLNQFEEIAKLMTSERMQIMFGKILAGEIRKPNTFSVRTLQLLVQMDSKTAQLFKRFSSIAISFESNGVSDARVLSIGGNASSNALIQYGLSFDSLNILQEHGLIISDFNSYIAYNFAIVIGTNVGHPLKFQNEYYVLVQDEPWPDNTELRVHGVAATSAGRELLKIVDVEDVPEYEAALELFFETKKLSFRHLPKDQLPPHIR